MPNCLCATPKPFNNTRSCRPPDPAPLPVGAQILRDLPQCAQKTGAPTALGNAVGAQVTLSDQPGTMPKSPGKPGLPQMLATLNANPTKTTPHCGSADSGRPNPNARRITCVPTVLGNAVGAQVTLSDRLQCHKQTTEGAQILRDQTQMRAE